MEFIRKIGSYLLFFRKQETPEGQEKNGMLKGMHTINKISIAMFLFAMIVIIVRFIVRG